MFDQPEAGEDADSEVEDEDGGGEGGERHAGRRQHRPRDGHQATPEPVGEVGGDGTWGKPGSVMCHVKFSLSVYVSVAR